MEELKPCPFCGGEAEFVRTFVKAGYEWCDGFHVRCKACEARTGDILYDGKLQPNDEEYVQAAGLWNRRAAPENKALTLEDGFDITNADGTPIDYEALGLKYKDRLCYCDIDGFYLGQDGQLVLMDDCGETVSIDRGDYHVEARNPEK